LSAARVLRVLHVDPEHGFSGGETQVLALVRHLAERGHANFVATSPEGGLAERIGALGPGELPRVGVVGLRCGMSHDPRGGLALRSWLARHAVDVVHLHTARALSLAPYLSRGPVRILTRRMDYPPRGSGAYVRWLYGRVDAVIAISAAARDALVSRGVPAERITLVPSGVELDRFAGLDAASARRELGVGDTDPVVAIVGSLHRRKGHQFLLRALRLAGERGPAPLLLAAGDGPERAALEELAAELGIAARVRWLGRREDVRPVLAAADVVAAPSLAEGLGVAVIEALAAGKPVVASAVGGLRELVRDERDGLLVPAADAGALADVLGRLLGDADLRDRLGRAGRARAADFSIGAMARGTEAVYERALAARARRGKHSGT
jgi:glycosyltransferase involved in cell wall biosynthesis